MINTQLNYFGNFLSPKDQYNIVKSLAKLDYADKKSKIKIAQNNFGNSSKLIDTMQNSKFMQTLELLPKDSAFIIENEFTKKNNSKDWYEEKFSRTTYYKNRKKAIKEFLYFYINV